MKLADIASNTAIPGSHMSRTMKTRWLILIIILFAGCVWYANYSLHFNGFMWNDSQDYNQMARNVYEGKGFSTSVLRPISFSIFDYLPHPEYTRPPLYAYLLALCYRMFGVNDPAAVLVDGIFFVVFAIATYLYAMEYSKSRLSAVLITALLICSPWVLVMSIQGSTDIVFAALFMLFLYLFARFYERPALAGLLAGLLYLVRWNAVFIVGAFILTEYNPFKE
jgi:hypothetical protein